MVEYNKIYHEMMQVARERMNSDFIKAFFTAVRHSTAIRIRRGRVNNFTLIKSGTKKRFFLEIITSSESDEDLRMEIYNDYGEHVATLNHLAIFDASVESCKWWWRKVVKELTDNLWTAKKKLTAFPKDGGEYIRLTEQGLKHRGLCAHLKKNNSNETEDMQESSRPVSDAPTYSPEPEVAGMSEEDEMYQKNRLVDAWPAEWELFEAERTWFLRYSVTDRPGIDYIAMLQPIECSGEAAMYGLKNSIIGSLCPAIGGSKLGTVDQVIPGMIVDAETYEDCAKALRPLVEEFMASQEKVQNMKPESIHDKG